jgi:hypothetical protein
MQYPHWLMVEPSPFSTLASKQADGSSLYGVQHSADKRGGGAAARASAPVSSFLHIGLVVVRIRHASTIVGEMILSHFE